MAAREIKFRAWRPQLKRFRFFDISTGFNVENADVFESVEQYTGLKDKNGVDIYEGDIVSVAYGSGEIIINEKVEYMVNKFELSWSCNNGFYGRNSSLRTSELLEVIGNTHENPELLFDD